MTKKNIVFFDDYCNICDVFVSSLLLIDYKKRLYFAPLGGRTASSLSIATKKTVVFINERDEVYYQSDAVLEILKVCLPFLSFFFQIITIIIPKVLRDYLYSFVAKYRYKVFGKKQECRLPTEEEKAQFLD